MVQPRYAYPRAHLETMRPFAKLRNHANHLMTRNEWRLAGRQLAFDDMQVGAADRTGANPEQHFASARPRRGRIGEDQRIGFNRRYRMQQASLHGAPSAITRISPK
jgi:hypothetical protein